MSWLRVDKVSLPLNKVDGSVAMIAILLYVMKVKYSDKQPILVDEKGV